MTAPTLQSQVLAALRAAGDRGVCVSDFDRGIAYSLRNRIGELRRGGHVIQAQSCRAHQHRSSVVRYTLVGPPQSAEQQSFAVDVPPTPVHRDPTFGGGRRS